MITLGISGLPADLTVALLFHELGHCLMAPRLQRIDASTYLVYRLGMPLTRSQQRRVMRMERWAWRLGFRTMACYGIKVGERMRRAQGTLLRGHARTMRLAHDRR